MKHIAVIGRGSLKNSTWGYAYNNGFVVLVKALTCSDWGLLPLVRR
jgi:hypothetical protein